MSQKSRNKLKMDEYLQIVYEIKSTYGKRHRKHQKVICGYFERMCLQDGKEMIYYYSLHYLRLL